MDGVTSRDDGAREDSSQLPDDVVDRRFEDIVAHWGDADPDGTSVSETEGTPPDLTDPEPPAPAGSSTPEVTVLSFPVWRGPTGPSITDETPDLGADEDDEDDGFVPPAVALPPGEDLHYWGAVAGLVLGPVMVLYVVFARPFHATWWLLAGIAAIVLGFGLLVLRAPRERDPFDSDDGSRV